MHVTHRMSVCTGIRVVPRVMTSSLFRDEVFLSDTPGKRVPCPRASSRLNGLTLCLRKRTFALQFFLKK